MIQASPPPEQIVDAAASIDAKANGAPVGFMTPWPGRGHSLVI
jgi:hypothetical protein